MFLKMISVNSSMQLLLLPLIKDLNKAAIFNLHSIISMQKSFIKAACLLILL